MKLITTTEARKNLGKLVEAVNRGHQMIGLGRRDKIEAVLLKYPEYLRPDADPWTQLVSSSGGFDFWHDEPELYSLADLKHRYA